MQCSFIATATTSENKISQNFKAGSKLIYQKPRFKFVNIQGNSKIFNTKI
jgi:hypothetical protein